RRTHHAVVMPEGDELPVLERTAHDDAVAGPGMADVLQAEVELVGEEVGQSGVRVASPGRVASGGEALVERVRPVLDSQVPTVATLEGAGDVARGEDTGDARLQMFVHDDAVIDAEAGSHREVDAGRDAD